MRTRDDEADEASKMNVNGEDSDERNNTEIQSMIMSGHMCGRDGVYEAKCLQSKVDTDRGSKGEKTVVQKVEYFRRQQLL